MDGEYREPAMSKIRPGDSRTPVQRLRRLLVERHTFVTRLTHWINLLCVTMLLMSGLQIFNALPALYWGQSGADTDRVAFVIVPGNITKTSISSTLSIPKPFLPTVSTTSRSP
jgi:Prokaryotic cytochrome b561